MQEAMQKHPAYIYTFSPFPSHNQMHRLCKSKVWVEVDHRNMPVYACRAEWS